MDAATATNGCEMHMNIESWNSRTDARNKRTKPFIAEDSHVRDGEREVEEDEHICTRASSDVGRWTLYDDDKYVELSLSTKAACNVYYK